MNHEQIRLYGFDGDVALYRTPGAALKRRIELHAGAGGGSGDGVPLSMEEWDSFPPRHHLPPVDVLLDWLAEWVSEHGEVDENGADAFAEMITACRSSAEYLLDGIASVVDYRMAQTHLRDLPVEWSVEHGWTIDGKPPFEEAAQP